MPGPNLRCKVGDIEIMLVNDGTTGCRAWREGVIEVVD
jgi:hypothetical protein